MIFTTPLKKNSIKIMLLGSGELGKEIAIEAQRLGVEVISIDRYKNAPASSVSHKSYVIDMQDTNLLLDIIKKENPTYILPEIEAISIDALFKAEKLGFTVIPNAEAVNKTMNRKNIRIFVDKELEIKTSKYSFVTNFNDLKREAQKISFPCVVKPIMSSSGHGQSIVKNIEDLDRSWDIAKKGRGNSKELIVEELIKFDYEITLLTVKGEDKTVFCKPIGHIQKNGDYILSWQPVEMKKDIINKAQGIAKKVTDALGGKGIFGVEFFIKNDEVYFSELSPRPHDTGMVTMITQSQNQFSLHLRAILGLPLDFIFHKNGASAAYKSGEDSNNPTINIPNNSFSSSTDVKIFGKPISYKGRRLAVALAIDNNVEEAKEKVLNIIKNISSAETYLKILR